MPQKDKTFNTATTAVLQWFTYSFWGWTTIATAWLVWVVADFGLTGASSSSPAMVPTSVAVAAILLVIALVCDYFYSKREVDQKVGIAMVLSVIHAVLFGLLAVGSLIIIASNVIGLLVNTGSLDNEQKWIATGVVLFVLYTLIVVRVAKPFIFKKYRLTFRIAASLLLISFAIAAISGPVAAAVRTKDDRAVSQTITTLDSSVKDFVRNEARLPSTLDELIESETFEQGNVDKSVLKNLLTRDLITYTPNNKAEKQSTESYSGAYLTSRTTYYYELCGNYKYKDSSSSRPQHARDAGKSCKTYSAISRSDDIKD